jgi:hypothetical protein
VRTAVVLSAHAHPCAASLSRLRTTVHSEGRACYDPRGRSARPHRTPPAPPRWRRPPSPCLPPALSRRTPSPYVHVPCVRRHAHGSIATGHAVCVAVPAPWPRPCRERRTSLRRALSTCRTGRDGGATASGRARTTSTFLVSAPHRTARDRARAALSRIRPPARPPAARTPAGDTLSAHAARPQARVCGGRAIDWSGAARRAAGGPAERTMLRSAGAELRTRNGRWLAQCQHDEVASAWYRPPHPPQPLQLLRIQSRRRPRRGHPSG